MSGKAEGKFDKSLSVFISDLHVGGANPALDYTHGKLIRVVDEILAMRPLPRRVVCFGDVGLSYGLAADYVASKPILQRLVDAGVLPDDCEVSAEVGGGCRGMCRGE